MIYIVGNSLVSKSASDGNITIAENYPKLLEKDFKVQVWEVANSPIIGCAAKLLEWNIEKDSIIVIHAGCAELVPMAKDKGLGFFSELCRNHLNVQNPNQMTTYFLETIQRYKEKTGNVPYMTGVEFFESCYKVHYELDKIKAKKIVIGINFMSKEDWRYNYIKKADEIMKKIFGDLYFLDLFKEELGYLTGRDGIHLNERGHKYIYNYIKNQ